MSDCRQSQLNHVPVLSNKVLELLRPRQAGLYFDATVGAGGHSRMLLEASAPDGKVIACDMDDRAIVVAKRTLREFGDRITFVHEDFRRLPATLRDRRLDGALVDLGVSSLQLDDPDAGFSFRHSGPLDMRMDRRRGSTAAELVNTLSERELANIFWRYGEERRSRRVASAIVAARSHTPIESTVELAEIVRRAVGKRSGRIDPATRVFQALRVAVNEELEGLDNFLRETVELLVSGARLAVIAFHSLEDRIVKHTFRELAGRAERRPGLPDDPGVIPVVHLLTPRPLRPSKEEERHNPRSRSARLRAVEKL